MRYMDKWEFFEMVLTEIKACFAEKSICPFLVIDKYV